MDDRAAALLQHVGNGMLAAEERTPQIHPKHAFPQLQAQLVNPRVPIVKENGSVVVKHIHASKLGERSLQQRAHFALLRDIRADKDALSSLLPNLFRDD